MSNKIWNIGTVTIFDTWWKFLTSRFMDVLWILTWNKTDWIDELQKKRKCYKEEVKDSTFLKILNWMFKPLVIQNGLKVLLGVS